MKKLKPNAQKWVKALRSGKYKQAQKRLRYRGGMCCLGVACDLAAKSLQLKWNGTEFDGKKDVLPPSVQKWLGISNANGDFGLDSLSNRNDAGDDFETIADLIEEYAEELGVSA
jgi:hypothetical protein